MAHASVNGQNIWYEDSGGDGPAVLFSHGVLMDGSRLTRPHAPRAEAALPACAIR